MKRSFHWLLFLAAILVILLVSQPQVPVVWHEAAPLDVKTEQVGEWLQALRATDGPVPGMPAFEGVRQLEIYHKGEPIFVETVTGEDGWKQLATALRSRNWPDDSHWRLSVWSNPGWVDRRHLSNDIWYGRLGFAIRCGEKSVYVPVSEAQDRNERFQQFLTRRAYDLECGDGRVHIVGYRLQQWMQPAKDQQASALFRGDEVVPLEAVNYKNVHAFMDRLGQWLLHHTADSGRLTYLYFPSYNSYSRDNNMVRQWMSTHSLAALYAATRNPAYLDAWKRNRDYNMAHYYVEKGDLAYIYYSGGASLGSSAVALMALTTLPDQLPPYERQYKLLKDSMLSLYYASGQDKGRFHTWFLPQWRDDNHSFYPGESLLAFTLANDAGLADIEESLFRDSAEYYMQWWMRNNNELAFIPWQTMAYWHRYQKVGDDFYRKAIFEMNDYLVQCQELSEEMPDAYGQYTTPACYRYGGPHASSTGVYTEGLAHAYALAREEGDTVRQERYGKAIRLGLRSLMQLQVTERNSWYMPGPESAYGGIRTTLVDNRIRVDNVQHAVVAVLAVLEHAPELLQ